MRIRRFGSVTAWVAAAAISAGTTFQAAPAHAAPEAEPTVQAACPVTDAMIRAANYWVAHGTDLASTSWQNGSFYTGNLAVVLATGQSNHRTFPWAKANNYALGVDPNRPFSPDGQAVGEAYLDLHVHFHPEPENLVPLRQQILDEVASVERGHVGYWNYAEAVNRSMPSFARLGVMDGNAAILEAMHKLFHHSERVTGGGLFNELTGLWRHDAVTPVFGSRTNGEAFAGLAKVLEALPSTDPHRAEYLRVFQRMAVTIQWTQRPDGFWNVDLLNPWNHPGPESGGTALLAYGVAWGVNHGVLDPAEYTPVATKAWQALQTKALNTEGFLGYVQKADAKPWDPPGTATETAAYGVGAFLQTGRQVALLTPGCHP
ncbi:glycoside hydrolase family 88 protein [Pendulispora rubella]|uniref:Glycoside hydrolase family 88 protein n=1 Tax=Pendulispora rubella TaxID=2741070 RepID=A0ABZ2L8S6_9BACT